MTVHSSKGLEFDYIYIIGLEDGLFPLTRNYIDDDIEEERRLFYVAITRAKKEVVLSSAKTRRRFGGSPTVSVKSRFLNDIPDDVIETSEIKNKTRNVMNRDDNYLKLNKGTLVEHGVFGAGKIVNIEGVGDNSKLTILFANNITKKLIFKYANLKRIK